MDGSLPSFGIPSLTLYHGAADIPLSSRSRLRRGDGRPESAPRSPWCARPVPAAPLSPTPPCRRPAGERRPSPSPSRRAGRRPASRRRGRIAGPASYRRTADVIWGRRRLPPPPGLPGPGTPDRGTAPSACGLGAAAPRRAWAPEAPGAAARPSDGWTDRGAARDAWRRRSCRTWDPAARLRWYNGSRYQESYWGKTEETPQEGKS